MDYTVDKAALLPKVTEIISRVAARTMNEGGESMYDTLKITSRDTNTLDRLFLDAETAVLERFRDVVYMGEDVMEFNLPDFDERMTDKAVNALDNFIIHHVVSYWFGLKEIASAADYYATMAGNYMTTAVRLLRQRMDYQN